MESSDGESCLVVSGFGPFGEVTRNPSGLVARALAGEPGVRAAELPVSFRRCVPEFDALLAGSRPRALLGLGVHGGDGYRLERRARAVLTSEAPDNDGLRGAQIRLDGPPERRTELDLERLAGVLEAAGSARVEISEDAGGYVCERLYRHLLERAEAGRVPGVFLHVPPLSEVPLDAQLGAVRSLAGALLG
ncbi:MAG: hypothetical protein J4G09_08140 [Proteobacteria bacterium]|nr:hypothetical protein [Pseudomonadota bacterium]